MGYTLPVAGVGDGAGKDERVHFLLTGTSTAAGL